MPRKQKDGKLKLKTHKATSKRFRLSGSGVLLRTKGGKSHLRRRMCGLDNKIGQPFGTVPVGPVGQPQPRHRTDTVDLDTHRLVSARHPHRDGPQMFVHGLHQVALLGQHALAYTVLIYCAIMIHRRLLWFGVVGQMPQVFPLFLAAQLVEVAVRLVLGGDWPGWDVLLSPLIETLLWPVLTWLLLAPQRRPPDPDENRPL